MHELRGAPELRLPDVLARLSACDLVLVEGYKRFALPKLEIHRPALGKPLLHPGDANIVGLATDTPSAFSGGRIPVFGLDAYDALATFVEERAVYATAGG
jgi:molybdopterin-guanine dinucleotide biosynthesis protein B